MPAPTRPRSAPRASGPGSTSQARVLIEVVSMVLRRPDLWLVSLRQYRRVVPPRWWRRRPFLPVPTRAYLEFRVATAYGSGETTTPEELGADVVSYLEWCRSIRSPAGTCRRR